MLSKQVKQRIARNKDMRRIPKWRRCMHNFLTSQLPPAQSHLSSKHFGINITDVEAAAKQLASENARADEIFRRLKTWKARDWRAFERSGDEDLRMYNAVRQGAPFTFQSNIRGRYLDLFGKKGDYKKHPAITQEQYDDFEGDTLNNLPPMELRDPVVRVPKMRDPIGEYIHTYGHPPISISREMQDEIDQALADREKAMEELKKKGE